MLDYFLTLTLVGNKKLAVVNSVCSGGTIGRLPESTRTKLADKQTNKSIDYQVPCQQ